MDKENLCSTGLMIFSPPKAELKASITSSSDLNRQLPSILCEKFQKALWIEFDTVLVKSTNHKQFKLINPNNDRPINVSVDKVPDKKGFSLSLGNSVDGSSVDIPANGSAIGTLYWIPQTDMAVREVAILKLNNSAPLQLSIHGTAGIGQVMIFMADMIHSTFIISISNFM